MTSQLLDKCRGSLIGGAVGDALGYPVEFIYSFVEIAGRYGEKGITEFDTSRSAGRALISDDTQMTLYTAEGLLEAVRHGRPVIPVICDSYLAWFGHQAGEKIKISYDSKLAQIKELNENRAPGNTCLSALRSVFCGKKPANSSKGCGGIMRIAPIGVYGASHSVPVDKTARMAGDAAKLTHLHPLSTYSSAACAVIIQLCIETPAVNAGKFRTIVDRSLDVVSAVYGETAPEMDVFKTVIKKAVSLADSPLCDWQVIERSLGGGWVAEETLAIAVFSVLRHIGDFRACMVCAVNHGGDSDSTGAVAGNIIGAILGYRAIPAAYTDRLEFHDLICSVADDLTESSTDKIMEYTPSKINRLNPGEIFVFGSNLAGHHGGGAARAALDKFGAVWGQGVGLQGQSYAIPTMQGGVETIRPYVDEFIEFATSHPSLKFYVTRIGCGIAGFDDAEIAPLFAKALGIKNIILPKSFVDVIA